MYVLRNETDSDQVRNTLEELTCVLESDVNLPASDADEDEGDLDEEDLVEVRELELDDDPSVNTTQPVRQRMRHLLEIPADLLPCPERSEQSTKLSDLSHLAGLGLGLDKGSMVGTDAAGQPCLAETLLLFAVAAALVSA